MVKPYIEEGEIRTFSSDVKAEDLVWHRDHEDRTIHVLEGHGWKFQYDDQLPFFINPGDTFKIPKESYHRLLLGATNLVIRVQKFV